MCKKGNPRKLDKCLRSGFIMRLNNLLSNSGERIVSSCCGHGKYPMTLIVQSKHLIYEFISGIPIPRKKRFYKKDKQGFYYIPEVINKK